MLPADTSVIRLATEHDADALRRLAALDSARPLTGRVLIGEIDGVPAAARSLATGRTIADPFLPTARLCVYLRVRAAGLEAVRREPLLARRMLAAVRRPALAA
jgi:hypothetical protein